MLLNSDRQQRTLSLYKLHCLTKQQKSLVLPSQLTDDAKEASKLCACKREQQDLRLTDKLMISKAKLGHKATAARSLLAEHSLEPH